MSLNRVLLTGNLAKDAELKHTGGGSVVVKFRLAVNGREKRGDDWQDRTEWVDAVMFGSRAESVSRYLSKGAKVGIDGRLRYSEWVGDNDQRRSKLEVIVDDLELLTPRGQGAARDEVVPVDDLEDIPF